MSTETLQWLAYERALAIKYQLGAVNQQLLEIAQANCESDHHGHLFGIAYLVDGIRSQASDLMEALSSSPDLMSYEPKIGGQIGDRCMPSLAEIAKEAWEKKRKPEST